MKAEAREPWNSFWPWGVPEKHAVPVTVGQPGGPVVEDTVVEVGVLEVLEAEAVVLLGSGAIIENE